MGEKHEKTRRHSSLQKLPPEILQTVEDMLLETDTTYDDVVEFLRSKGYEQSRSAIARYGKVFFDQARDLRIMEEQSRVLVSEAGGDGLVLEEAGSKLLAKNIIRLVMDQKLKGKQLTFLTDAFAKLQRSSVSREKLKADLKKKADKAMKAIEKKTGKQLTPETLAFIKEQVYGLAS